MDYLSSVLKVFFADYHFFKMNKIMNHLAQSKIVKNNHIRLIKPQVDVILLISMAKDIKLGGEKNPSNVHIREAGCFRIITFNPLSD